jgi:carbon-monoxide dehydrogenase medium subunit
MFPAPFDYRVASSLEEAVGLLAQFGEDARVLAGGHSLLPLMKLGLAEPKVLIDLGRLRDLAYIRAEDGVVRIGALTTHAKIEWSERLAEVVPLLPEVARVIGDPQVRNRGTIGGSLVHADPRADFPAAVLALDAQLRILGPSGERMVAASEFFQGVFTTVLRPDEVLVEVVVPLAPEGSGSAYVKFPHPASGYAVAGVAAYFDPDGVCVGITGASATPYRARAVEQALADNRNLDGIAAAAALAADGVDLTGDLFASSAYRAHLARVCTRRALETAVARAEA